MVTLYWKYLATGYIGHGSPIPYKAARSWISQPLRDGVVYWVVTTKRTNSV